MAAPFRYRLKRQSWRSATQVSTSHLPAELTHRAPVDSPFPCPWEESSYLIVNAINMAPPYSQDDTTPYLSFIRHLNAPFFFYNNGSATAGTLNGGAGMVVTERDPANPTTLLTKQQRGTASTSSYDEEKEAKRMALQWLSPSHATAVICTDCQSRLKTIQCGSANTGLVVLSGRMPAQTKRQLLPTVLTD